MSDLENFSVRIDLAGNQVVDMSEVYETYEAGTWWRIEELEQGYLPKHGWLGRDVIDEVRLRREH